MIHGRSVVGSPSDPYSTWASRSGSASGTGPLSVGSSVMGAPRRRSNRATSVETVPGASALPSRLGPETGSPSSGQDIVGSTKLAPLPAPSGHREVTVLVLV